MHWLHPHLRYTDRELATQPPILDMIERRVRFACRLQPLLNDGPTGLCHQYATSQAAAARLMSRYRAA